MTMNGENFGTKKDAILTLYERNKNEFDNVVEFREFVQEHVDVSDSHIHNVLKEEFGNEEPTTELQEMVLEVYDEDNEATYNEISIEVAERLGEAPPDKSTVGEYIRRFRDGRRREVEKYEMDPEVWDKKRSGPRRQRERKFLEKEEPEAMEETEPEEEPEDEPPEPEEIIEEFEEEEGVQFDVSDDEALTIIRAVLKFEDDDLARELLRQYK